MTGWRGHQVLYFGDHPYSDLADVTLEHGWRTGAIITELTVNLQFLALLYRELRNSLKNTFYVVRCTLAYYIKYTS